jgi:hypothetical protein
MRSLVMISLVPEDRPDSNGRALIDMSVGR